VVVLVLRARAWLVRIALIARAPSATLRHHATKRGGCFADHVMSSSSSKLRLSFVVHWILIRFGRLKANST
jgi:hypothetical protein